MQTNERMDTIKKGHRNKKEKLEDGMTMGSRATCKARRPHFINSFGNSICGFTHVLFPLHLMHAGPFVSLYLSYCTYRLTERECACSRRFGSFIWTFWQMDTTGPMRINLCLINVAHLTTLDVRVYGSW